jgi:hypothetical protein
MEKSKIEIRSIWGKLLFKFEKEDNSIKETLLEGLKKGANLQGANLQDAYLRGADLRGADLQGAEIDDPEKYKSIFWIIPEQGSFEAWKKLANDCIAKIQVPAKAKRTCNLKNRKCRAEYVKVLAIWNEDGKKITEEINKGDGDSKRIKYTTGQIIKADSFDDSVLNDCSHGIHFFVTKQEAIDY